MLARQNEDVKPFIFIRKSVYYNTNHIFHLFSPLFFTTCKKKRGRKKKIFYCKRKEKENSEQIQHKSYQIVDSNNNFSLSLSLSHSLQINYTLNGTRSGKENEEYSFELFRRQKINVSCRKK